MAHQHQTAIRLSLDPLDNLFDMMFRGQRIAWFYSTTNGKYLRKDLGSLHCAQKRTADYTRNSRAQTSESRSHLTCACFALRRQGAIDIIDDARLRNIPRYPMSDQI